jgi:hypothetical protein
MCTGHGGTTIGISHAIATGQGVCAHAGTTCDLAAVHTLHSAGWMLRIVTLAQLSADCRTASPPLRGNRGLLSRVATVNFGKESQSTKAMLFAAWKPEVYVQGRSLPRLYMKASTEHHEPI